MGCVPVRDAWLPISALGSMKVGGLGAAGLELGLGADGRAEVDEVVALGSVAGVRLEGLLVGEGWGAAIMG